MRIKESAGSKLFDFFNMALMIILMFITVYPMFYILFASVSSYSQLMVHRGLLFMPLGFTTKAYESVFRNSLILKGYLNTLFVVLVGVTINVLMTSLGAYFLSRKGVMWKNHIMFMIIFTMFFSGGLMPFYFTVKGIGLENSLWALIIPVAMNTFNLIIMKTSFQAIPDSMEESAKIDGANDFIVLFKIILPLSLPVVAVMILYYGVGHWNAWFNAMIFLRDRNLYPLQLILREILIDNDASAMSSQAGMQDQEAIRETIKYAVIMVATLPIVSVYPFLQKYFVKGVLVGAVKG